MTESSENQGLDENTFLQRGLRASQSISTGAVPREIKTTVVLDGTRGLIFRLLWCYCVEDSTSPSPSKARVDYLS
jgi:hypothetical protein